MTSIDPAVWALSAAHPEQRPEWLQARLMPVVVPQKKKKIKTKPPYRPDTKALRTTQARTSAITAYRDRIGTSPGIYVRSELPEEIRVQPTISEIIRQTAAFYKVSVADLVSHRRWAYIMTPRLVAVYLASTMTTKSLSDIGRIMGGRDHSTIINACTRVKGWMQNDGRLRDEIEVLMLRLSDQCAEQFAA